MTGDGDVQIRVDALTIAYGDFVVMQAMTFDVRSGSIFFIIGDSGSGKSTLFSHLVGLQEPASGTIEYAGERFTGADEETRERIMRRFGVLFQNRGLFSSMTLAENVGLPLSEFSDLSASEIDEVVQLKLALVGLSGFGDFYPDQLSGGMQKRAGLARAMALDPEILLLDEPSSGLDPVTSRRLDELILQLRGSLGATVVIVSHELPSIMAIADDCIFLDTTTRTISARGAPKRLRADPPNREIAEFLGQAGAGGEPDV